jgi:hypothetical protein
MFPRAIWISGRHMLLAWMTVEAHAEKTRRDRLECRRRAGNRRAEAGP